MKQNIKNTILRFSYAKPVDHDAHLANHLRQMHKWESVRAVREKVSIQPWKLLYFGFHNWPLESDLSAIFETKNFKPNSLLVVFALITSWPEFWNFVQCDNYHRLAQVRKFVSYQPDEIWGRVHFSVTVLSVWKYLCISSWRVTAFSSRNHTIEL